MKTTLTIEQSAHLIELGVDAKLASEREFVDKTERDSNQFLEIEEYPRFALTDLLSILPKEIDSNPNTCLDMAVGEDSCGVCYINSENGDDISPRFYTSELIDALYQLAIYCLENNHINTEKK